MKKCPYCAEEIQSEAIKCKHCSEFLDGSLRTSAVELPWYFKTSILITLIGLLPPLALPSIIYHPKLSKVQKFLISLALVIFSWYMYKLTMESLKYLEETMKLLENMDQIQGM